jgi:phage terminase large subunit
VAKKRAYSRAKGELTLNFGEFSEKQKQFLASRTLFTCYGGARGGGKSHVVRMKAIGMALTMPGIRILMVRCHYPELEENLIRPLQRFLPSELYSYNGTSHLMTLENGSIIKFGHYDSVAAENEYQGTEYDVLFIDEATQISERAFKYLCTVVRGTGNYPRRVYLSCNPGGVGHSWVKRLFIEKDYKLDSEDPEENENPDDYTFIFATVDDNPWMLASSPMYKKMLASLPPELKAAHRYGDWDALSGSYFKNFSLHKHVRKAFKIPERWPVYRAFDYGLDMLAVGWFAVDEDGRCWCFRYFEEKGLVVQDAAKAVLDHTLPNESPQATYAPPDMWSRTKDTGKAMAELFATYGLGVVKSSNNRVQGHMIVRDMLNDIPLTDPNVKKLFPEGDAPKSLPGLMFFDSCGKLLKDLQSIQADEKNPNDCAKMPHDVTHSVDMLRYFCISRVTTAESEKTAPAEEDEGDKKEDYQSFMCGGDADGSYLAY